MDAIFQADEDRSQQRPSGGGSSVGKLSCDAYPPAANRDGAAASPTTCGRSAQLRVGKLNTDNLFQSGPSEAAPKQLPAVGKLSMVGEILSVYITGCPSKQGQPLVCKM